MYEIMTLAREAPTFPIQEEAATTVQYQVPPARRLMFVCASDHSVAVIGDDLEQRANPSVVSDDSASFHIDSSSLSVLFKNGVRQGINHLRHFHAKGLVSSHQALEILIRQLRFSNCESEDHLYNEIVRIGQPVSAWFIFADLARSSGSSKWMTHAVSILGHSQAISQSKIKAIIDSDTEENYFIIDSVAYSFEFEREDRINLLKLLIKSAHVDVAEKALDTLEQMVN